MTNVTDDVSMVISVVNHTTGDSTSEIIKINRYEEPNEDDTVSYGVSAFSGETVKVTIEFPEEDK